MEFSDKCPVCGKLLQLQQINLNTAIVICLDLKCPYPVNGKCLTMNRTIEQMSKPIDLQVLLQSHLPKQISDDAQKTQNEEPICDILNLDDLLNIHLKSHMEQRTESANLDLLTNPLGNQPTKEMIEFDSFLDDLLNNI